jgi:cytochrome c biogenesis protein CcdA
MVNRLSLLVILMFLVSLFSVMAVEDDCIYYFYGTGCDRCEKVDGFLSTLEKKYPHLNLQKFDVYYDRNHFDLLENYYVSHSVPKKSQGLPVAFIPGSYFVGDEAVTTLLEQRILDNTDSSCPSLDSSFVGVIGNNEPQNALDTLSFFQVTAAAGIDSLNPFSLALLLLLLVLSLMVKDHEEMLKKTSLYLTAVFLVYFLHGTGLFIFFKTSYFFAKVVGIIGITIGFVMMNNFFGTLGIFFKNVTKDVLEISKKVQIFLISYYGVFILGFIFSLLSLGSSGNTFLLIQKLFGNQATKWIIFPMLLYYCVIFVLPLFTSILVIYFSKTKLHDQAQKKGDKNIEKTELWKKHHHKLLNFVVSLIIFVIGILLVFS